MLRTLLIPHKPCLILWWAYGWMGGFEDWRGHPSPGVSHCVFIILVRECWAAQFYTVLWKVEKAAGVFLVRHVFGSEIIFKKSGKYIDFFFLPLVTLGFVLLLTQSRDSVWIEMQLTAADLTATCCILPNGSRLRCCSTSHCSRSWL